MPELIAVDIDDTLYSYGDLAREVMCDLAVERDDKNLRHAAYTPWNEWRTPPDIVGLDVWQEVIAICHSDKNIISRNPFPHAVETLCELSDQGHQLIYISNRSEAAHMTTINWLLNNAFPAGNVICTNEGKAKYIKECRYLIDDRPKTLVEFTYDSKWKSKKQRVGFGLHTQYNSSLTDVPRIKLAPNWSLLRRFFVKEGLISDGRKNMDLQTSV